MDEQLEKRVKELEEENRNLKKLCDRYEDEHETTFVKWQKEIETLNKVKEYINELSNILKK